MLQKIAKLAQAGVIWIAHDDVVEDFDFQELAGADVCGWAWRVQWVFTSGAGYEGPLVEMQCLILMDGTVVQPTIAPYKGVARQVYGSPMVQPLKVRQ
jgi:hypothetical protein